MTNFLIVAHWDDNNYITGLSEAADLAEAESKVAGMISEGDTGAFHTAYPASGSPRTWVVDPVAKTVTEGAVRPEQAFVDWANFRAERDSLLAATDWTQGSDTPLTDEVKSEWAVNRQSLRDLPANTPDPANPTWPTPPE